jgi:hypothetical protein
VYFSERWLCCCKFDLGCLCYSVRVQRSQQEWKNMLLTFHVLYLHPSNGVGSAALMQSPDERSIFCCGTCERWQCRLTYSICTVGASVSAAFPWSSLIAIVLRPKCPPRSIGAIVSEGGVERHWGAAAASHSSMRQAMEHHLWWSQPSPFLCWSYLDLQWLNELISIQCCLHFCVLLLASHSCEYQITLCIVLIITSQVCGYILMIW